MDNLKSVKSTTDFPKNNICKKQKRIKFVDRFRECITFDDGGAGGGEKSELKLWGIGSTRVQLSTIR